MLQKTWINRLKLKEIFLVIILLGVLLGNGVDLIEDYNQQGMGFFFLVQVLTIILALGGLYLLLKILIHSYQERQHLSHLNHKVEKAEITLQQSLNKLKKIAKEYNKQLLEQFYLWNLTPSEQEIALFLLKGLSMKEIAEIRNTTEKTVRQQASVIYRKSGVAGRHEFSAWFFEDMLGT